MPKRVVDDFSYNLLCVDRPKKHCKLGFENTPTIRGTVTNQAEDLSLEYKYDILSENTLNSAVEHVHAMYVRNPSK